MKKSHGLSGLLCAAALSLPAHAADTKPLLQEGKHTLFQRVLTYPGCQLAAKAGEAGRTAGVQPLLRLSARKTGPGRVVAGRA
jgi:hypothetical protein